MDYYRTAQALNMHSTPPRKKVYSAFRTYLTMESSSCWAFHVTCLRNTLWVISVHIKVPRFLGVCSLLALCRPLFLDVLRILVHDKIQKGKLCYFFQGVVGWKKLCSQGQQSGCKIRSLCYTFLTVAFMKAEDFGHSLLLDAFSHLKVRPAM